MTTAMIVVLGLVCVLIVTMCTLIVIGSDNFDDDEL